jgi:hypothetical protein
LPELLHHVLPAIGSVSILAMTARHGDETRRRVRQEDRR